MASSVLAAGPVLCCLCGDEFHVGRSVSPTPPAHDEVVAQERDSVVDDSFLARRQKAIRRDEPAVRPLAHLGAFISAAREAGFGAHPAVVALAQHHNLLLSIASSAEKDAPSPALTATQRQGLTELVAAGDKPGDWAVAVWYQALGTEGERPMAAGNLAEAGRRRNLARVMLKADGTLLGPGVEVFGREFLAGEQVVVGPLGIRSLDLDPGVPGRVEQVDPEGTWLEVEFLTAGHYRFTTVGSEAAALTYGYAEVVPGLDRVDLRTIDLRPAAEMSPVSAVSLPEINF